MAFTKSGWYLQSLLYSMLATAQTGTPAAIALTGQDANNKISLHSSTGTDYTTELATGGTTTAIAWVNTNEVTGTGWATGGPTLSVAAAGSTSVTTTFAIGGAGPYYLQYSWTNPLAVSGTTLTGVAGCIIYANGITAPVNKPMLLLLCFGGSTYSTVSGVFGITPSGSGLSQITLTA
jgi:hypothetical protein